MAGPFVNTYERYVSVGYGGESLDTKPATKLNMNELTVPDGYMIHYEPSGTSRIIEEPDEDVEAWAKFRAKKIRDQSIGGPAIQGNTTMHMQANPRYQEFFRFDPQGRVSPTTLEPIQIARARRTSAASSIPSDSSSPRLIGLRSVRFSTTVIGSTPASQHTNNNDSSS
ncbi:hypothetical protein FOL47_009946 [Perkinsus chesapeaki]|uniref:Uncharacterized protein n=1 Tax=Perkinsus chesapeaki TaxID=330153 RepID=A0A7J6MQQ7_PERCH|nr:hypothetical protein FOL47_009946 [Perkinsus chesapeaki]